MTPTSSSLDDERFTDDPLAQPEPEYEFDQRVLIVRKVFAPIQLVNPHQVVLHGAGTYRTINNLVSGASAAAEFSVARFPRAAVSPGDKSVSRHFPPPGLSLKHPISPCTTLSGALIRGSQ
jgi:hypothetical protein